MICASSFRTVVCLVVVQARRLLVELFVPPFHDEAQPNGNRQNNGEHRNADAEDYDDGVTAVVGIVLLHTHAVLCHHKALHARLTLLVRVSVVCACVTHVITDVVLIPARLYRYPLRAKFNISQQFVVQWKLFEREFLCGLGNAMEDTARYFVWMLGVQNDLADRTELYRRLG